MKSRGTCKGKLTISIVTTCGAQCHFLQAYLWPPESNFVSNQQPSAVTTVGQYSCSTQDGDKGFYRGPIKRALGAPDSVPVADMAALTKLRRRHITELRVPRAMASRVAERPLAWKCGKPKVGFAWEGSGPYTKKQAVGTWIMGVG